MSLIWCLCVCLVILGLAFRHSVRATLQDLWLHCRGQRVRVPARTVRPFLDRPVAPPSRQGYWPPTQVSTWVGPLPPGQ